MASKKRLSPISEITIPMESEWKKEQKQRALDRFVEQTHLLASFLIISYFLFHFIYYLFFLPIITY